MVSVVVLEGMENGDAAHPPRDMNLGWAGHSSCGSFTGTYTQCPGTKLVRDHSLCSELKPTIQGYLIISLKKSYHFLLTYRGRWKGKRVRLTS